MLRDSNMTLGSRYVDEPTGVVGTCTAIMDVLGGRTHVCLEGPGPDGPIELWTDPARMQFANSDERDAAVAAAAVENGGS